jgi:hypothetical protein
MPTSEFPSRVPPNQAATSPSFVSAIVEAWHEANGALSKMNSCATMPGCPGSETTGRFDCAIAGNSPGKITTRARIILCKSTTSKWWKGRLRLPHVCRLALNLAMNCRILRSVTSQENPN